MIRIRIWFAALVAWLFALYSVERIHEPINLASFVYLQAAGCAILIIVVRRLERYPAWQFGAAALVCMVVVKSLLGYELLGLQLPLTITELVAIGVTVAFARQIASCIAEFEASAESVAAFEVHCQVEELSTAQQSFYRELRRARQFERRAALLTFKPTDQSLELSYDHLAQEVVHRTLNNYVRHQISTLLSQHSPDCALVAHQKDTLLLMLPEAGQEGAMQTAAVLRDAVRTQLGLELEVGMATFPDQEVTLAGLLERAEKQMQSDHVPARDTAVAWPSAIDVTAAATESQ